MAATAGYGRKIYAKATSGAPSGSDLLANLTDAGFPESMTALETTAFGGDGNRSHIMGLFGVSPSLSGDCNFADSPQNLIRSNFRARTTFYLTHLPDGTNGYTYPVKVSEYSEEGSVDGKATFSASFVLDGAPTARP